MVYLQYFLRWITLLVLNNNCIELSPDPKFHVTVNYTIDQVMTEIRYNRGKLSTDR